MLQQISVLQSVAVCCSVLQSVAVCCSVLQRVACARVMLHGGAVGGQIVVLDTFMCRQMSIGLLMYLCVPRGCGGANM